MGKQISRGGFLLEKNNCSCSGKSGSSLLTLSVSLFPRGEKAICHQAAQCKARSPTSKNKDSGRNRLCHPLEQRLSESSCLPAEARPQEKSSPRGLTSWLRSHRTGKSGGIRDVTTLWCSASRITDSSAASLAQLQCEKYLRERRWIREDVPRSPEGWALTDLGANEAKGRKGCGRLRADWCLS